VLVAAAAVEHQTLAKQVELVVQAVVVLVGQTLLAQQALQIQVVEAAGAVAPEVQEARITAALVVPEL
jgi:hypothetical protein